MTNYINYRDVVLTIALLMVVVLGFLYELAGETVPGWHTISYSAHRSWIVRGILLAAAFALFVVLIFHFASTRIVR